eukprot:TRINITY_DN151_c0_g1_i1.p1 TRINITY_DN151_c0_g1~~TRINITY_DN151_c0_g1_i1.p1  ORF type:complete len:722 (-),score=138.40 TRINITY_DN151_c0_g1_i1:410-2575(-)
MSERESWVYPEAKRTSAVTTLSCGQSVPDPYQWLEDPNSPETISFVDQQSKLTEDYLKGCALRDRILNSITEKYDYPKYGCPWREGTNYYFFKNDGLQNHHVLYVQDTLQSEPKVFFDPNSLSEDGDISLSTYRFSESGDFFAYALSQKGSDWTTIHIKTVDPSHPLSEKLTEKLSWVKYSGISWTHDDKGFFYSRFPQLEDTKEEDGGTSVVSLKSHQLFYHRLGTPQEEDVLIFFEAEHSECLLYGGVSDDGKYLTISISKDCDPANKFYYFEFPANWNPKKGDPIVPVVRLIDSFDAQYQLITNQESLFYFFTNLAAPRYRVISMDIKEPSTVYEVLPQTDHVLSFAECVNHNKLLVCYIRDVVDYLELYSLPPASQKIELLYQFPQPSLGTILAVKCRKDWDELFYSFGSFLSPGAIFRYSFTSDSDKLKVFRETEIKNFDATLFQAEQHFYKSKDGTKIPIFLVFPKKMKKDGKNPVWMYGYGGFNSSLQPYFSVSRLVWMQNLNGIFAMPNLRGGGEYGEDWHKAGIKEKKQNVFDDFIAAAEFLVKEQYTSPELITINGGSNGGLLVAACLNQRPDLFGCAIASVALTDMLKYHKFTIGHFWVSDYGCADTEEDFKYIIQYSPLHNVRPGKPYPATLLTTADHDDRVSPFHSYKFISELQYQLGKQEYQKNPLLIRIEKKGGHGHGRPVHKILSESADGYAFVAQELKLEWKNV